MVILTANRLDEIPKDAIVIHEREALKLQWESINEHDSERKVWSLKCGAGILGALSGMTGVYINHHYRGRLRLGSFGSFSTYLPIVVLPASVSTLYHKVFIQSQIILRKEPCPVCVQVRASVFQVALGIGYPSVLAPFAAYMFAVRHFTYRLPPLSKPKELFAIYKKMTRPLTMFLAMTIGFHTLAGMALTHKEILDFHRLEHEIIFTNGHSATNGHSTTNGHSSSNGFCNGSDAVDQIAVPEMCFYCFQVLDAELNNLDVPNEPSFTNDAYPLFVTWKIGQSKKLRGCIGTFTPLHLHSGLREYAITSAFNDSRFSPIIRYELPRLTVSVSILMGFEEARGYLDWTLGVHGIRIEFLNERGSVRNATFLPKVASEQGWDQVQTIDSLLRKGGYRGQITQDTRQSIKLTRDRLKSLPSDNHSQHKYRGRSQHC